MSQLSATSYWLLSFPNDKGSASAVLSPLVTALSPLLAAPARVECSELAIPTLKVGTLDGLMALSDDLGRADSFCEGVVRRGERAIIDSAPTSGKADDKKAPIKFTVRNASVHDYIKRWSWDS
jgi:hypothetical protein